jgi:hypothetical protein
MFGFFPLTFLPIAATGVPLGDFVVAAAAAASTFGGEGVEVCNTITLLGESWV